MGGIFSRGKGGSAVCTLATRFPIKDISDLLRTNKTWSDGTAIKSFEYAQRQDANCEGYLLYQSGSDLVSTSWISVAPNRIRFTSEGVGNFAVGNSIEYIDAKSLQVWVGDQKSAVLMLV